MLNCAKCKSRNFNNLANLLVQTGISTLISEGEFLNDPAPFKEGCKSHLLRLN